MKTNRKTIKFRIFSFNVCAFFSQEPFFYLTAKENINKSVRNRKIRKILGKLREKGDFDR